MHRSATNAVTYYGSTKPKVESGIDHWILGTADQPPRHPARVPLQIDD